MRYLADNKTRMGAMPIRARKVFERSKNFWVSALLSHLTADKGGMTSEMQRVNEAYGRLAHK